MHKLEQRIRMIRAGISYGSSAGHEDDNLPTF